MPLAQVQAAKKSVYFLFCCGIRPPKPPLQVGCCRSLRKPGSKVGRCRGLQGWEVLEGYQAKDWPGGLGLAHIFFAQRFIPLL